MTRPRAAAAFLGFTTALMACGSPTLPPAPPPVAPPAAGAPPGSQPPAAATSAVPELPAPPLPKYEAGGRRDPFEPPDVREGSGPAVASAKLTGIVRGPAGPLVLVETAEGLGYILRPGDTLGEGRLLEVGPDRVVFSIPPRPGSTTNRVVLTLPSD